MSVLMEQKYVKSSVTRLCTCVPIENYKIPLRLSFQVMRVIMEKKLKKGKMIFLRCQLLKQLVVTKKTLDRMKALYVRDAHSSILLLL
ncbi:hypothetical protein HOLleu_02497 [Holothuria leucospilota]|uniref:Uncharacterized protein n=1 Tax=Holothuria leucospilota TaxID=206669 RepID=A0A9Q1CQE9_HOLLE|nr:hypothetical protein HOLleu_02497 [Holothuria leucospilota]